METFEVALEAMPSDDVTMTLIGDDNTDLMPTPTALTFKVDNWSSAQTETLNTAGDEDHVNDEVTLTLTASGGGYDRVTQDVLITITDNLGVDIEKSEPPRSVTLWGNYLNPL